MCLQDVKRYEGDQTVFWKVFEPHPEGADLRAFFLAHYVLPYETERWYESEMAPGLVWSGPAGTEYKPGFHAFLSKEDAERHVARWEWDTGVIKKVLLKDVRLVGTFEDWQCVVADKMKILTED